MIPSDKDPDVEVLRAVLAWFGDDLESFADMKKPPSPICGWMRRAELPFLRGLLVEALSELHRRDRERQSADHPIGR